MIEAYQIEAISIGNGTASRETEDFINSQSFDRQIPVFVVSEQELPFIRLRRLPATSFRL